MSKILNTLGAILKEGLASYSTPYITLMRYDAYTTLMKYDD